MKGNNRYGAKGTIRCLACQRRKGKVCYLAEYAVPLTDYSVNFRPTIKMKSVNTASEGDSGVDLSSPLNENAC